MRSNYITHRDLGDETNPLPIPMMEKVIKTKLLNVRQSVEAAVQALDKALPGWHATINMLHFEGKHDDTPERLAIKLEWARIILARRKERDS